MADRIIYLQKNYYNSEYKYQVFYIRPFHAAGSAECGSTNTYDFEISHNSGAFFFVKGVIE